MKNNSKLIANSVNLTIDKNQFILDYKKYE